jgi:RecB family endonuclease NucS
MDDMYAGTDGSENNNIDQANADVLDEEGKTVTINDRFAYEQYLQMFCQENFEKINFFSNLSVYTDDTGKQGFYYGTNYGEIDILATDANGNFVVIELKRERAADKAVNQLGRYMQWVDENLAAKNNKQVRGILIAHTCNNSLLGSVKALRFPVTVLLYKLKIDLTEFSDK